MSSALKRLRTTPDVGGNSFTSKRSVCCLARFAMVVIACLLSAVGLADAVLAQGYPPHQAASKMAMADGLSVQLFAGEPQIRQPILVKCDDRGRLWVIQYLQYPNPAGLQRVKVDRHSRTVYDRVPAPPPLGPRGADRITICEDTDGDGRAERFHDFVEGLNLCTGLAFGHGGVFVMQAPYLLFYPDRNQDDVPDANPEVLLTGFGMEDAQSLANHLTWGPDGWLYGVNGSTTTCHIRGIEFQQGVWRYHPVTKEFELFCEGGGNTFGVTFDEHGNLFYSTNGGPCIHAIQGAYYYKSFGKHGPLHNPYAYGFFNHVKYDRISLGPPTGGTIYLADQLPKSFHGTFLAGDFLGHSASSWSLQRDASTFKVTYRGKFLDSHDTWFGATDLCVTPDGSLYLSDFCDKRTAHPDPDADWDRSNGRIYRIKSSTVPKELPKVNLAKLTSDELVDLLQHRNYWFRDRARVLLASRNDRTVIPRLQTLARQTRDHEQAREALWALASIGRGAWDDALADDLLKHPAEDVRVWTVRLLGDRRKVTARQSAQLVEMAAHDTSLAVRCQLAASAKRLPAPEGLAIAEALLVRNQDANDPFIPLLIWWALEDKAIAQADRLIRFLSEPAHREQPEIRANRLRLVRRYAADGTATGDAALVKLLRADGTSHAAQSMLTLGLSERAAGLPGIGQGDLYKNQANQNTYSTATSRKHTPPSAELKQLIGELSGLWEKDPQSLRLALQVGLPTAQEFLRTRVAALSKLDKQREADLALAAEFGDSRLVPYAMASLRDSKSEEIRKAALQVIGKFPSPESTQEVLKLYATLPAVLQPATRDLLFSRSESARTFLSFLEQDPAQAKVVSLEQVRRIALLNDEELNLRVRKLWGNIQPGSSEEKLAEMRRFNNDLRAGSGDPVRGKPLFQKHCGTCHRLNQEGNELGPDLTIAARGERDALLAHIVDPSSVIRSQYLTFVVRSDRGTVHSGLIVQQDAASVTLLDARNQRTKIPRSQIDEITESTVSLMPEKLLNALSPQERRDLFSYLQKR